MWEKYTTIPFLNLPMFGMIDLPNTTLTTTLFMNEHKTGFLDFLQTVPFEFVDNKSVDDVITLEILGFLFENMLEDRNEKAAFYTPVEIVNYMCTESIIQSVITKLEPRYIVYDFDKNGTPKQFSSDTIVEIDDTCINKIDIVALIQHPHTIQNLTHEQLTYILKILMTLRINDPAVGSGAFPVGMLQLLTFVSACILDELGQEYELSKLKRNFIRYCLTGVDIDANAIEVCKLRIGLSILCDMSDPEPLPNMHFRFIVGNSLIPLQDGRIIDIEWDTSKNSFFSYDNKYIERLKEYASIKDSFFESFDNIQIEYNNCILFRNDIVKHSIPHKLGDYVKTYMRISFDWKLDFPEVMNEQVTKNVGFDIVIGNPPYVNIEKISKVDKEAFIKIYGEKGSLGKRYDLYQIFILLSLKICSPNGINTFILPNTFLMGNSYLLLRRKMVTSSQLQSIIDLPQKVFENVTVDTVIYKLKLASTASLINKIHIHKLDSKSKIVKISSGDWDDEFIINQNILNEENEYKINVHTNPIKDSIYNRLFINSKPIGEITESSQGIIIYKTKEDAEQNKYTDTKFRIGWKKLLRGTNIGYYENKWAGEYLNYGPWLWSSRQEKYFNRPKILLQALRNKSLKRRLVATYDDENYYNAHNLANIISKEKSGFDLKYILAIFNSKLINFWYRENFPNVNINPNDFRKIPIAIFKNQNLFVELVDKILINKAKKNDTTALEQEIDNLVYKLYALTYEEVKVIDPEFNLSKKEYEAIKLE
jgi:hypothetical protein